MIFKLDLGGKGDLSFIYDRLDRTYSIKYFIKDEESSRLYEFPFVFKPEKFVELLEEYNFKQVIKDFINICDGNIECKGSIYDEFCNKVKEDCYQYIKKKIKRTKSLKKKKMYQEYSDQVLGVKVISLDI